MTRSTVLLHLLVQIPGTAPVPARRLIFKHGQLRRKEKLEDAESAIKHFASASTP